MDEYDIMKNKETKHNTRIEELTYVAKGKEIQIKELNKNINTIETKMENNLCKYNELEGNQNVLKEKQSELKENSTQNNKDKD